MTSEETSILHQNVLSGTATRSAINCPTAAKTGTTSELVDAWLDGYTPNYSTVVWMGYPTRRVSMTDVHGEPQQGGYLPAEIWHAYMAAVTEGQPCVEFPPPKESISYQPFFGRFATTGRSGESEQSSGEPSEKGQTKKPVEHHPTHAGTSEPPAAAAPKNREPREPASPPPVERNTPGPAPTGGAEPHP